MKVDNQNPTTVKELGLWERDRSKDIQKKMGQIKKIQNKQLEDLKLNGDYKISKAEERNSEKLKETENKVRDRIDNLTLKLQKTKEQLENEENILKNKHTEKKVDLEAKFDEDYLKSQDHYQTSLSEYNAVADDAFNKTKLDQSEKMGYLINENKKAEAHYQNLHKEKMGREKINFENVQMAKETEHRNMLKQIEVEQLREKQKLTTDFERRMMTLKYEHEKQFNTLKKRFEEQLKQSDHDFKERYKQVVDKNKFSLDAINDISQKSIKEIKEKNEKVYQGVAEKQQDPFYYIATLEPMVKDTGNFYEISIKVPEFDKDKVQLNGHDREMKLTFNRNFTENLIKEDGSDNRYGRIESFTKIFNVPEPINAKTLDESYSEGLLTFKIQKL